MESETSSCGAVSATGVCAETHTRIVIGVASPYEVSTHRRHRFRGWFAYYSLADRSSGLYCFTNESSQKKTVFLREALRQVTKTDSARVIPLRFENVPTPTVDVVSCRALDRFEDKLTTITDWAPRPSTLLFFGSERMRELIKASGLVFEEVSDSIF